MTHFGLALQEYTHFTSPIRRYADVVVHRQLLQAIKSGCSQALESASSDDPEPLMSHAELASAAEVMNERHRASKRAQKECSDLYLLLLLHRYGLSVSFDLILSLTSSYCCSCCLVNSRLLIVSWFPASGIPRCVLLLPQAKLFLTARQLPGEGFHSLLITLLVETIVACSMLIIYS